MKHIYDTMTQDQIERHLVYLHSKIEQHIPAYTGVVLLVVPIGADTPKVQVATNLDEENASKAMLAMLCKWGKVSIES